MNAKDYLNHVLPNQHTFGINQVISLLENFANQSKWISVEDRLPTVEDANEFGKVLLCYYDNSMNAVNFAIVNKIMRDINWHKAWQPLPTEPCQTT